MHQSSAQYQDLAEDSYHCVNRIVLNAYFRMGYDAGGIRVWWRVLYSSEDEFDTAHLMSMARRFSPRVRAFAKAHGIPLPDSLENTPASC